MSNNLIQICQIVVDAFVKYFNTTWDTGIEERGVRASGKQLEQNNIFTNIDKKAIWEEFFYFKRLKESEVQTAMKEIHQRKAAGWDRLSLDILRVWAKAVTPSLTRLCNDCIRQKEWPLNWR